MSLLHRRNLVVVLVSLAITFSGAATSQAQDEANNSQLISVDFPGGTISDYVDALAKAAGSVNVLISPEAADFSMPAVKLTKVSISAAIDLVNGTRTDKNNRIVHLDVDHLKLYEAYEQATFKIDALFQSKRRPTVEYTHSSVWSIAYLIQDGVFSSDVVLDAIEMAIDVTKSTTKVDIRFHEATGLLIASGNTSQLTAIENVLGELGNSQQMESFETESELEKDLQDVMHELQQTQEHAMESDEMRAQLEEENNALRAELEEQMERFEEIKRMLQERDRMLETNRIELQELNDAIDRDRSQEANDDKSGSKNN